MIEYKEHIEKWELERVENIYAKGGLRAELLRNKCRWEAMTAVAVLRDWQSLGSPCTHCRHDSPGKDTCPRGAAPEYAMKLGVCAKMEIDKDKK